MLEDCDELIRSEAKHTSGQALSRLLNLTDGMLGQGRRVLVAITTNEDIARLHPAVVRPGRCLAQLEVGPLSRTEATTWLGRPDGIGPDGATLATLYALRDGDPACVVRDSDLQRHVFVEAPGAGRADAGTLIWVPASASCEVSS